MENELKITWNGRNGRTADGRLFRMSEDGKTTYERVGEEWQKIAGPEPREIDMEKIEWNENKGRTVDGRMFKRENDSIYEYVNGKYEPYNKAARAAVAGATPEQPLEKKEPEQAQSISEVAAAANPAREQTVRFLERLANRRGGVRLGGE